jgi:hypothetical protein
MHAQLHSRPPSYRSQASERELVLAQAARPAHQQPPSDGHLHQHHHHHANHQLVVAEQHQAVVHHRQQSLPPQMEQDETEPQQRVPPVSTSTSSGSSSNPHHVVSVTVPDYHVVDAFPSSKEMSPSAKCPSSSSRAGSGSRSKRRLFKESNLITIIQTDAASATGSTTCLVNSSADDSASSVADSSGVIVTVSGSLDRQHFRPTVAAARHCGSEVQILAHL